MKKVFLITVTTIFTLAVHAQRFDWVRTYYGPDFSDGNVANEIFGSVIDREGNLYVLGQFFSGARWDDDTRILPFPAANNRSAIIAKFSPDGEMLWHKEIYVSKSDMDLFTIRMKGDTAIMVYVTIAYPYDYGVNETNQLYYLDTMLTTSDRFPAEPDSLRSSVNGVSAFITMSLEDGSVIEEHFLKQAYVKNDGTLLRNEYSGLVETRGGILSFVFDKEGNVILIRRTSDFIGQTDTTWSPSNHNLKSVKLLIDGGASQLQVPLEPSFDVNYQLVKLSPHFDSVITSTYIFDSTWIFDFQDMIVINLNSIDVDVNDNIYISLNRSQRRYVWLPVKNSDRLYMKWNSCMIRYDSDLMPTGLAQVASSYTDEGHPFGSLYILSTFYDSTSNSLFLRGTSENNPAYNTLSYNGDTLDLVNNACWLRLNADDLSLISYGKARTTANHSWERTYFYSDKHLFAHNGSFVASGNRVFCQLKFQTNILFNDRRIDNPYGMGIFIWDYDGHELDYIDYNSNGMKNQHAFIHLMDSSLLISGSLVAAADFGSHHVNAAGNSIAYLARYTDTSFIRPYVYKDPHIEQIDEVEQQGCLIYPNPTNDKLIINVNDEQITKIYITTSMGQRKEIVVHGCVVSLSGFPAGVYYLQVITNKKNYQQKFIKI